MQAAQETKEKTVEEELDELEKEAKAVAEDAAKATQKTAALAEFKSNKPAVIHALEQLSESLARLVDNNPLLTKDSAAEFIRKFESFRSEDQGIIVDYLTKVTSNIVAFVDKYNGELAAMAKHRERVEQTLKLVDEVLNQYR
jgi:ABC-type transporter Mla subunit MlaD